MRELLESSQLRREPPDASPGHLAPSNGDVKYQKVSCRGSNTQGQLGRTTMTVADTQLMDPLILHGGEMLANRMTGLEATAPASPGPMESGHSASGGIETRLPSPKRRYSSRSR